MLKMIILLTALLIAADFAVMIQTAWNYGGKFAIVGNRGYRKGFFRRIYDGLKIVSKF